MKISHINISRQINFSENSCYLLVIENAEEFYSKTKELYLQIVCAEFGNFVLSENKEENISKQCLFLYNYYDDIFDSKKVQNLISGKIIEVLKQDDFVKDFADLNSIILKINQKIEEQLSFNLNHNLTVDFSDFVKMSNIKINSEESLLENLLSFIQLNQECKNITTVICVNLTSVLPKEKIELFEKQLRYMQLNLLLIEPEKRYELDGFETIIIDNDLCVI